MYKRKNSVGLRIASRISYALRLTCVSSLLVVFFLGTGTGSYAQVDPVYATPQRTSRPADYNLKLGQVEMRTSAGTRVGYSDNINYASRHSNPISDGFVEPYLSLGLLWPVTELNTLSLDFGVSYRKYFSNSEADQNNITIAPNTAIDFEFYVGKYWRFVLFDRIRYDHDPLDFPTINNTTRFGRFQNDAGLLGFWEFHQDWMMELGYTNTWVTTNNSTFDFLDRMTHTMSSGLRYQLSQDWTVGVRGSYQWTEYDTDFNNDGRVFRVGPFASGRITDYLTADFSAAYILGDYDSGGRVGDTSQQNSYAFSGRFNHEVNRFLSHSLEGGRTSSLGDTSNFLTTNYVRHTASWRIIRDLGIGTHAFLEFAEESGDVLPEDYTRYGAGINFSYQLTRSLNSSLRYTYLVKESNQPLRDYEQNMVVLDLNYRF